jgi:hypothetical protein
MPKQVLLDENLPKKLRLLLSAHKVVTAAYLRMDREVERRVDRGGGTGGI